MDKLRDPRPQLAELSPYDVKEKRVELELASNEHPLNLPEEILNRIRENVHDFPFNRYPDSMANGLRDMIAQANGLEPRNVLLGNGGDELIFDLLAAWGGPGRTMLNLPPTFAMYEIDADVTGTKVVSIPRLPDFSVDADAVLARLAEGDVDIVMIANPNNPTGNLLPEDFLIAVLNATDALVLVDEAYFEFSRHTMRPHMDRHKNLVVLRTFSKAFSMAGLRVGYLLAHEDVIQELTKVRQPYSVNSFSQWVAAMSFRERVIFESAIHDIIVRRDKLQARLAAIDGVEAFPSEANFVLFRVEHAPAVWRDLLHNHSVLIRDFSATPGLSDCLRVSVGTEEEIARFLGALEVALHIRERNGAATVAPADQTRGE